MQCQKRKKQGVWNTAIQGACVLQRRRRKAEPATAKPEGSTETTGEAAFCRKAYPSGTKRKQQESLISG